VVCTYQRAGVVSDELRDYLGWQIVLVNSLVPRHWGHNVIAEVMKKAQGKPVIPCDAGKQ
jgi:hypothetical protein